MSHRGHSFVECRRLHGERGLCPSGAVSMSFKPRSMVLRANPVMSDTAARSPHPAARTSLAAHNRRPRSSRFEPSASHRSRIASRSIMLTLVPISPMTENHPHPSHDVASPGKTDSVIFAAVLRCGEQRGAVSGVRLATRIAPLFVLNLGGGICEHRAGANGRATARCQFAVSALRPDA
jgi:hypothetical protein